MMRLLGNVDPCNCGLNQAITADMNAGNGRPAKSFDEAGTEDREGPDQEPAPLGQPSRRGVRHPGPDRQPQTRRASRRKACCATSPRSTCRRDGTGYFPCRHLYIIQFRSRRDRQPDPGRNSQRAERGHGLHRLIRESHIAEIDGRVAIVMVVEGTSDSDIVERFTAEDRSVLAEEPRQGFDRGHLDDPAAAAGAHPSQLPSGGEHAERLMMARLEHDSIFVA